MDFTRNEKLLLSMLCYVGPLALLLSTSTKKAFLDACKHKMDGWSYGWFSSDHVKRLLF